MHTDIEPQISYEEDQRGLLVHRYTMFLPINPKQLFYDYPELRKHEEIRSMKPSDVAFCWYMAHPSSPIIHWEKEDHKAMFAAKRSYLVKMTPEKYNRLVGLNFSEEMKVAMEFMASFKPGTRARLAEMLEATLTTWEGILKTPIDLEALSKGDSIKDVSAYITATEKIIKQIPSLLEQVEQRYSLDLNNDAKDESEYIGMLDDWHNENSISKAT